MTFETQAQGPQLEQFSLAAFTGFSHSHPMLIRLSVPVSSAAALSLHCASSLLLFVMLWRDSISLKGLIFGKFSKSSFIFLLHQTAENAALECGSLRISFMLLPFSAAGFRCFWFSQFRFCCHVLYLLSTSSPPSLHALSQSISTVDIVPIAHIHLSPVLP